jgi:hypothetical protein
MTPEQQRATWDETTTAEPPVGAHVRDAYVPKGLVPGTRVRTICETHWKGETVPTGTECRFERYAYSRRYYGSGFVWKYAVFRFPDGTERSLTNDTFTIIDVPRPVDPFDCREFYDLMQNYRISPSERAGRHYEAVQEYCRRVLNKKES